MTKRKPKELHKPDGRPTVMTPEVVAKLEEAYSWGCTDIEACLHAGISKNSLYRYEEANPKFRERKEVLKENPVLLARATVVREMQKDGDLSLKFLERKRKDEFSTKQEQEVKTTMEININEKQKLAIQSLSSLGLNE